MPPSVMQIHSPRVPWHQEETTTPRGVHCPAACLVSLGTEASQPQSTPSPSQQNVAHACLFAISAVGSEGNTSPQRPQGGGRPSGLLSPRAHHTLPWACVWIGFGPSSSPNRGSFGCSVHLPLGSRTVDPDSTTVWSGNLLHSSPQPHTAGYVLLFTQWSTRYCNQDLLRRALHTGTAPEWYCSLHAPLHAIALLRSLLPNHSQWRWTMRQSQLH